MTRWDIENQRTRDELLEALARGGYDVRSSELAQGEVNIGLRQVPVDVTIPRGFPYEAPKVRPIDGSGGLSWHADPDGHLCLWAEEESGDLPWCTLEAIESRVRTWFQNAAAGWVGDSPDLDLERYWPRTSGLVVYRDLDALVGRIVRLDRGRNGVWYLKPGPPPRQGKQRAAAVIDVGELDRPLRTFGDVLDRAGEIRERLERDVRQGRIAALLVRYTRSGIPAVVALVVREQNPVDLAACSAADAGDETLSLRTGPDKALLASKRVAIIGLGAIGCQVADLLARAGVGDFTYADPDVVRPGNCIRHLVTIDMVGLSKVLAVRDTLAARGVVSPNRVTLRSERVVQSDDATKLLLDHDLVVDATANGRATRLLLDGGQHLGRPVVSVCLTQKGRVARIDRVPLLEGESHAESAPEPADGQLLREGGCGDPVSPAPMWAAAVAAARATGVVVDILTGRRQHPASTVDILVAGEFPYDVVGTVG